MRGSTQNLGPIGSAVLSFIGYKRTDTQTDIHTKYIYIYICCGWIDLQCSSWFWRKFKRNWIFATNPNFLIPTSLHVAWWCKLLIFQTYIIWSNRAHSFTYLRTTTSGCIEIGIRKEECVAKTQFVS